MHRSTVLSGWQLPYLRVALILRRLQREPSHDDARRRDLAAIARIDDAIRRAGWFN
jgi:hypothetical protein